MGNKVNPIAFRLGPVYTWSSRWFADNKNYKHLVLEDVQIRRSLLKKLKPAGISRIEIERSINRVVITIYAARPGVIIGRGGQGHEDLKKFIAEKLLSSAGKKESVKLELKVEPIKEPSLDAYLVAVNIADQLVRQIPAKRVLRSEVEKVMSAGAKGVKVRLSGRVDGAEIGRIINRHLGMVPLSSIKALIDYAHFPALTKSGYVGVKVWICKT